MAKRRDNFGYTKVVLEIGDWNMDSVANTQVMHGLFGVEWQTISNVSVVIRTDDDVTYSLLSEADTSISQGLPNGTVERWNNTNIYLKRRDTGGFDSVDYDSTSYNRGWITFEYYSS